MPEHTETLPDGSIAVLRDPDSITQRAENEITHEFLAAGASLGGLSTAGFDARDPATWGALEALKPDAVTQYEAALIKHLVREFVGANGLTMPADPLDLPKAVFGPLAAACLAQYQTGADFSPDALATDPKAPPAS